MFYSGSSEYASLLNVKSRNNVRFLVCCPLFLFLKAEKTEESLSSSELNHLKDRSGNSHCGLINEVSKFISLLHNSELCHRILRYLFGEESCVLYSFHLLCVNFEMIAGKTGLQGLESCGQAPSNISRPTRPEASCCDTEVHASSCPSSGSSKGKVCGDGF